MQSSKPRPRGVSCWSLLPALHTAGKTPDVPVKAPQALPGPGAAAMAGTRCPRRGPDPRPTLVPPGRLPAGARARLRLGGGAVSFRPRVFSSLPGFLSVSPPALFPALLLEARTGPRRIQGTKASLLKPSWEPRSLVGDRERARLRTQGVALLQREGSPSFASLVKCLEVILRAAVYSFPVGLENRSRHADIYIYIGHADL